MTENKLSLSTLESWLWDSANILRGSIDSSDFKNYFGKLRWNKKLDRWWDLPFEEIEKFTAKVDDFVISTDGFLVGRNYARVKKEDLPLLIVQRVA